MIKGDDNIVLLSLSNAMGPKKYGGPESEKEI